MESITMIDVQKVKQKRKLAQTPDFVI